MATIERLKSVPERKGIVWKETSAKSFEDISKYIDIPEEVVDLRFLDIGAGGSDFTATLLERGADAYAVDHLYSSRSDLKGRMKKFFEASKKRGSTWLPKQEKAFERFYESIKNNPQRYKDASAEDLPFLNNYFDHVISVTCIGQYLDSNKNSLFTSLAEAIRVTKPEGMIQIFPFQDEYIPILFPDQVQQRAYEAFYEARQFNQRTLLGELQKNPKIDYDIMPTTEHANSKLVIIKKTA